MYDFVEIMKNRQKLQCLLIFISTCMMKRKFTVSVVYLYDKYILMSAYGKMAGLRRITIILQTVDKVPGLHRGFSIAVINISMILPVFIKKNSLLINSKVKRCVPCTWYNYPIRRFRL